MIIFIKKKNHNMFMKRGLMCLAIIAIMTLSFASAIATTVNIKTDPNCEVQIAFIEDDSEVSVLENQKYYSDPEGDASFTYNGMEDSFRLIVFVKKDGTTKHMKKFTDGYEAGEEICFQLTSDVQKQVECQEKEVVAAVEPVADTTEEAAIETTQETQENLSEESSSIGTGFSISDIKKYINNGYFYGGVGFTAFLVAGILFAKHKRKNKKSSSGSSFSNFGSREPSSMEEAEKNNVEFTEPVRISRREE